MTHCEEYLREIPMQQINTSDYFDANLLDGKSGKVSADQTKIRFGDLFVDVSGEFTRSVLDGDTIKDTDPAKAKQSFLSKFPPSAPVTVVLNRYSGVNGELYWLLTAVTPIPKTKLTKGSEKTNFVAVLGCGTVE